jgi:molybdate transport system substrate-binding protein
LRPFQKALVAFILSFTLAFTAIGHCHAEKITIAAASDLKFAMEEIVANFKTIHREDEVSVVYGSSGNFYTQIQNGAPYDLFFSADSDLPNKLQKKGMAVGTVTPYARGRIVLWSASLDATKLSMASLTDSKIARIAIANPSHAPYGMRAEEALRASKLWDAVKPKLVLGENVTQAALFAETKNADVGIIALSLAINPKLVVKGGYWLIPESLHQPLDQAFVITKRAQTNAGAKRFADYMSNPSARATMIKHGLSLPGETSR